MSSEGEKFFTGLIIGAVVGLAIGILSAPRPGEETRQMIKEKLDEVGKKIKQHQVAES